MVCICSSGVVMMTLEVKKRFDKAGQGSKPIRKGKQPRLIWEQNRCRDKPAWNCYNTVRKIRHQGECRITAAYQGRVEIIVHGLKSSSRKYVYVGYGSGFDNISIFKEILMMWLWKLEHGENIREGRRLKKGNICVSTFLWCTKVKRSHWMPCRFIIEGKNNGTCHQRAAVEGVQELPDSRYEPNRSRLQPHS